LLLFGCQYHCNRLPGKNRLQSDLLCGIKTYTLTHLLLMAMAVDVSMNVLGQTVSRSSDSSYKPSFLTDQELKHLVLEVCLISTLYVIA